MEEKKENLVCCYLGKSLIVGLVWMHFKIEKNVF